MPTFKNRRLLSSAIPTVELELGYIGSHTYSRMVGVMAGISLLRMTVLTWVILMCVSPTWTKEPQCFLRSCHALSNGQGPTFSDYRDSYADGFDPETIITFLVTVEDPDGLETVIASYRNRTEGLWSNITMQDVDENSTRSRYRAYLHVEVPEPGVYVWDIRYVANDTLGHSGVSDVVQHYYTWDWPAPDPTPVLVLVVIGVGTLIMAVGVTLRRGMLRPKT
ncbi:MAG: hypothetical protein ACE5H4_01195 [Candidatus Thorarchaeota archaeon]